MNNNEYKVAIIGRANVGKSTLFNRLGEIHKALVSAKPHTTRDRKYLLISWNGTELTLIDTGGVELTSQESIAKEIQTQADKALKEADLILFLVDAQVGITPDDRLLARLIRASQKPFFIVANKADNKSLRDGSEIFQNLASAPLVKISAINGSGTGDLLDEVVKELQKKPLKNNDKKADAAKPLRIAIVGKPNVGKSSLINALLGEQRIIVSPVAFTTREAIDIPFAYKNENFIFVDTAGLRKKSKVGDSLEKAGASQSRESIRQADIVLLMTDVNEPLTVQDKIISSEIQDSRASIIILANKWDLIKKADEKTINKYRELYQQSFPFLSWAPIIFISAQYKRGLNQVLETILNIKTEREKTITENALSKFLKTLIKKNTPKGKADRGVRKGVTAKKRPYIHNLKQIKTNPPIFSLDLKGKISLNDTYLRYIERNLREKFGFSATPLKIQVNRDDK